MSTLSVRQIKDILDKAGVSYKDCNEKSELVARLQQTREGASSKPRARPRPSPQPQQRPSYPSRAQSRTKSKVPLGKNPDGSDGGEVGEQVRRICSCGEYYETLQVKRAAKADEIKKAYRKLALKLHPDKCQLSGGEEAFKKVSAAFSCLSDDSKRTHYDRFGQEETASSGGGMHHEHMDAERLFQAFSGFARGGGGGGGGGGVVDIGDWLRSMVSNPMGIVTVLLLITALWNVVGWVFQQPGLLLLAFLVPAEYRKQAGIIFLMLAMSGILS